MRRSLVLLSIAALPLACGARASLRVGAERRSAGGQGGSGAVGAQGGSGGLGAGGTTSTGGSAGAGGEPGHCPPSADGTPTVRVETPMGTTTCIDTWEITRGQYEAWLGSGPDPALQPPHCDYNGSFIPTAAWPPGGTGLEQPVVHVDWCDGQAYCVAQGRRLCGAIGGEALEPDGFDDPTRSEWFNGCSSGGASEFPYGDDYAPQACNGIDTGNAGAVSVGTMSACRTGDAVYDLSGNVWEWEDACTGTQGEADFCRVRGGGFNNASDNLRCGADSMPGRSTTGVNVGFRCCADPVP